MVMIVSTSLQKRHRTVHLGTVTVLDPSPDLVPDLPPLLLAETDLDPAPDLLLPDDPGLDQDREEEGEDQASRASSSSWPISLSITPREISRIFLINSAECPT